MKTKNKHLMNFYIDGETHQYLAQRARELGAEKRMTVTVSMLIREAIDAAIAADKAIAAQTPTKDLLAAVKDAVRIKSNGNSVTVGPEPTTSPGSTPEPSTITLADVVAVDNLKTNPIYVHAVKEALRAAGPKVVEAAPVILKPIMQTDSNGVPILAVDGSCCRKPSGVSGYSGSGSGVPFTVETKPYNTNELSRLFNIPKEQLDGIEPTGAE